MLDRVHRVPLHEMDRRLLHFLYMSQSWYQGLAHVLNNRYPENMKRSFTNPEHAGEQYCVSETFYISPNCISNSNLCIDDFHLPFSQHFNDCLNNKTTIYTLIRPYTWGYVWLPWLPEKSAIYIYLTIHSGLLFVFERSMCCTIY